MKVTSCRICSSRSLAPVLRLGDLPAVNYFPSKSELSRTEPTYPLNLCLCRTCGLVMLDEVVSPQKLFRKYHYLTSASQPLVEHFAELAMDCRERGFLTTGTKVLDIGANDGTLLYEFKKLGALPLGIDPAMNAVERAGKLGIEVLPLFFDDRTAKTLARRTGRFGVITCTNVFAHNDKVGGFLAGIERLLDPNGVVIMEFAHLLDMVVKGQFDVIYHEHVSYFSLRPLMRLFADSALEIFDAKKVLTQGGSIRIYARHKSRGGTPMTERLKAIRREEDENHIDELATLQRFAADVRRFRRDLRAMIAGIRKRKLKIVGLGAPAKGVILLNYCGIGPRDIAYIVDSTALKQGRFLPGSHIPVFAEEVLEADADPCDYFLLLSWNFQDALLKRVEPYRANGAKVIVPFPKLRIV